MIIQDLRAFLNSLRRRYNSRWVMVRTRECRQAREKIRWARERYLNKNRTEPDENIGDEEFPDDESKKVKYPFENLVLGGGGVKGISYVGLIKVLEEHGISEQIKRYAGTSAGSLVAASLAVGFNSYEIQQIVKIDFKRLLYDALRIWYIPNFITDYGLNHGVVFYKFLGDVLAIKTKEPDITFEKVYKKYGKELCIVTVNVETGEELYCHVKTTPNMPIRLAVRMSMSIPWLFTPVAINLNNTTNHFVDGGLYMIYPVHCYDGWYLSMDKDDKFHKKNLEDIMDIHNRFNIKEKQQQTTIGAVAISQHEHEFYRKKFEETSVYTSPGMLPKTKLSRTHSIATGDAKKMTKAMGELLKILAHKEDGEITKDEFKTAFNDKSFKDNQKVLFGEGCDADTAFTAVDTYGEGKITFYGLVSFLGLTDIFEFITSNDHKRLDTTDVRKYFRSLISGLSSYAGKVNFHKNDIHRTIEINSWYINGTDFDLEEDDKQFLIEEGKGSTRKFLKNYVYKNRASLQERSKDQEDQIVLPHKNEEVLKEIRRIVNSL